MHWGVHEVFSVKDRAWPVIAGAFLLVHGE